MHWAMIILRLLHILGGVFWAGTIFFLISFLLPAIRQTAPDSGKVMYRLTRNNFVTALPAAALVTILAGLAMYWLDSGHFDPGFMTSPQGAVLTTGAVLAIIAFAIGMAVMRPATLALAVLYEEIQAGGGVPTGEQGARIAELQARSANALRWVSWLLTFTVISMATWRYF